MICKRMIRPELQPLRGGEHGNEGPPHQQALCGRCQKLGRNCRGNLSTMMGSLALGRSNDGVDDDDDPEDERDPEGFFNEVDAYPEYERDSEEYFDDPDNYLDYEDREGEYDNQDYYDEYGGESDEESGESDDEYAPPITRELLSH